MRPNSRSLSIAVLAAILTGSLVGAAPESDQRARVEEQLRRQREAFARGFDLEREHPRLAGYVRVLSRALRGPAAFRQPTLAAVPFKGDDRLLFLRRAAGLAAERFSLPLDSLTVGFAKLQTGVGGRVWIEPRRADVQVAERHRDSDDRILAIVAHEFAHTVIESALAGSREVAMAQDESFVDAAAVMVGLGPMILRASYGEEIRGSGSAASWRVVRIGELDPVAIAYLTMVQAELAGHSEDERRRLLGDWVEPVWSFRLSQWNRLRSKPGAADKPVVDCPTCLTSVPAPERGAAVACPVCGQRIVDSRQ
jgi:hypothetical protein